MSKIKIKSTIKDIKALDKTADVTRRAKNAFIRTKEQTEQTQQKVHNNYVEYAGDKVNESTQAVARESGQAMKHQGKKAVQKVKKRRTVKTETDHSDTSDGSTSKQAPKSTAQESASQKAVPSKAKPVGNQKPSQSQVKRSFMQNRTRNMTRTGGKTVGKTGKGTIKKVQKSVKTAGHMAKTTIKTSRATIKATQTSAKTAKVTAKVSMRAARVAGRAAVTGVRLLAKAVVVTVKAAALTIKSLVAIIAAGGGTVLVIVIVLGVILFIVNSAFGLFYTNEETGEANTISMSQAVADINDEFSAYIDQQVDNASAGHDNVSVVYDSDIDGDSDNINNWVDVLGIYAVKTTMAETDPTEVAMVTEEKKQIIKDLYWEMNTLSVHTTTEMVEETDNDEDNETDEPIGKTTIHVKVSSEDYADAAQRYGFNEEQIEMLDELMASENHPLFAALIGIDCYGGLSAQELEQIRNSLPADDLGADIVRYALTRIGDPYSQVKRGTGRYVDCSYLVRWAYNQAGVSSYKAATAAEQARYCVNNDMLIAKDQLRFGDVIFWRKNGCDCGRYMEIHHVAIYIGNGKIIEASSSRGCVVVGNLWGESSGGKWQILYYAHPYNDE